MFTVVMTSEEYGNERFEYDTLDEAVEGIRRLHAEVLRVNDGIYRVIGIEINREEDHV